MSLDSNLQSAFTAVGTAIKGKISSSEKGVANGVATLDGGGKIPSAQLPSFVDDVVEYANLAAFPATGVTGIMYVAIDTNRTYRWSGTVYTQITSGAVDSVAGKTGVVTLVKSDVGLGNVDNTADVNKAVLSATKLATARTISISGDLTWSTSFDGTGNVTAAGTLANSGVTSGTYKSVTVNAKGLVTGGTNPTTVSGYGITDAMTTSHSANAITGFGTSTVMNGTAAAGTSTLVSRADHVHASDTSKANTNQTMYIGNTAVAINRSAAAIALTGITSIDGNAATAAKLLNSRTINGVGFDGTANITVEDGALRTDIGATNTDYVAVFNTALV